MMSPGVEELQLELKILVVKDVTNDNFIPNTQLKSFQQRRYYVAEIPNKEGNFVLADSGSRFDEQGRL